MDPVLVVERSVTTGEERNVFEARGKKLFLKKKQKKKLEIGWW